MRRDELLVGIERVGLGSQLPIAIFCQLLDALLGGNPKLAVRVLAQEILVGLGGIGGLRGLPVFPDATAAGDDNRDRQQHGDQSNM